MNWNILVRVARFQLVDRTSYTVLPWGVLGLAFVVNLVIATSTAGHHSQIHTGALSAIYAIFFFLGTLSLTRSLPFALALGVSRRSYYTGTALLAVALAAAYGLPLAVLTAIERASGGWGVGLYFFRVAYILPGPWYLTWLTSFVGLALLFVYGMWVGLVYQRWNLLGLLAFGTVQVTVLVAGVIAVSQANAWSAIGRFFTTLSAAGLTGLLAAVVVALLAGGYATIRRVTV